MTGSSRRRAADILRAWDEGQDVSAPERALVLAALVEPGASRADLGRRPLGRLAALLVQLRSELSGPTIDAVADCVHCGTTVEFALDAADLSGLADKICDAPAPLTYGAYELTWRNPCTEDLLAVAPVAERPDTALLARCVHEARRDGRAIGVEKLPDEVIDALCVAMSNADPLAEIAIELNCPDCERRFDTTIDLPSFVWAEVEARARRLLIEVDALARAYGWSEADTVALSDTRRAEYLRLVGDGAL